MKMTGEIVVMFFQSLWEGRVGISVIAAPFIVNVIIHELFGA